MLSAVRFSALPVKSLVQSVKSVLTGIKYIFKIPVEYLKNHNKITSARKG